jgi:hypothetical protein
MGHPATLARREPTALGAGCGLLRRPVPGPAGLCGENLATARQMVLNLLKQDTSVKVGIKNKRKACGWSDRYLFHILGLVK